MELFRVFGSIFLKENDIPKKLDKIDKKAGGVGAKFKSMAKAVGGFVLAGVSIAGTVAAVKNLTKATMEQEKAEKRLEQLMMNVAGTRAADVEEIKRYASELQNVGVIGDEVAMAGASQLATFNLQASTIKGLLPSLNDLAVSVKGYNVSQDDMINLGNLVGKAMQGQVGALTRYGVTLSETQQEMIKNGNEQEKLKAVTEALQANFGGLNKAMSQTTEGSMKQMKNAWGDMKEMLGAVLLPKLGELAVWFAGKIPEIQAVLKAGMEVVGKAIDYVSQNILPPFIELFKVIWRFVKDNIMPIFNEMASQIKTSSPEIKKIFVSAFKTIKEVLMVLWKFIRDNIIPIYISLYEWIKPHIPEIKRFFVEAFGRIQSVIRVAWEFFKDNLLPILEKLYVNIQKNMPTIQKIFEKVFGIIKNVVGIAWGIFEKLLLPVLKALWEFVEPTFPLIGEIIETAFNTVLWVLDKVVSGFEKVTGVIKGAIDWIGKFNGTKVEDKKPKVTSGFSGLPQYSGIPQYAEGTSYHRGGMAIVGEQGPELVDLPKGSRVSPLDKSGITININEPHLFNDQDADRLGDLVVKRLRALGVNP